MDLFKRLMIAAINFLAVCLLFLFIKVAFS